MPLPTVVSVASHREMAFPDRCVACGEAHPDSAVRFSTTLSVPPRFWPRLRADVPACSPCARRMKVRRWGTRLTTAAVLAFGSALGFVFIDNAESRRLWILLGVVVALAVQTTIEYLIPPPAFDMVSIGGPVDYFFRSVEYAEEFVEVNREA